MYNDENNSFEKSPDAKIENVGERAVPPEEDFAKSFETSPPPEFAGNTLGEASYGQANPENLYYGESKDDQAETDEQYDEDIADAAAIINFGLNAAAQKTSVGQVMETIKKFDIGGREDPIGDLFNLLGVDTPEEHKELNQIKTVSKINEQAFREGVNAPSQSKTKESAIAAIEAVKDLIRDVENSEEFSKLNLEARKENKDVYDYIVSKHEVRDLTVLFKELASWKNEPKEEVKPLEEEKIEK